jgi:phage tail-like protein
MEPKTIEAGGVNDRQIHLLGPLKFSQVTLKRGMTSNLQLWTWMSLAGRSTVATASGTITMWNSDSTPVIEFALTRCLPVRMRAPSLNARDGLVAIEELSLVYETMTVGPPGGGPTRLAADIGVSAGIGISAGVGFSAGGGISI